MCKIQNIGFWNLKHKFSDFKILNPDLCHTTNRYLYILYMTDSLLEQDLTRQLYRRCIN